MQSADKGVVTFGPGQGVENKGKLITLFSNGEKHFRSVRYLGCTALELAYVARGGTEGFICIGLKPWDYAAGRLLIEEAGGKITDYDGNPCELSQNYFLASNGIAHEALLKLVASVSV
jgi:myo-inositol-1(or 4)-monophosphatase